MWVAHVIVAASTDPPSWMCTREDTLWATPWVSTGAFPTDSTLDGVAADVQSIPFLATCYNALIGKGDEGEGDIHFPGWHPFVVKEVTDLDALPLSAASIEKVVAHGLLTVARIQDGAWRAPSSSGHVLWDWLDTLPFRIGRAVHSIDVYATGKQTSSASFGWHMDGEDVLILMVHGRKRFRVASHAIGSPVVVDTVLRAGDALYIPAMAFHCGGGGAPFDSILLSISLGTWWPGKHTAQRRIKEWIRLSLLISWATDDPTEDTTSDDWTFMGSPEGRRILKAKGAKDDIVVGREDETVRTTCGWDDSSVAWSPLQLSPLPDDAGQPNDPQTASEAQAFTHSGAPPPAGLVTACAAIETSNSTFTRVHDVDFAPPGGG
uniref:JmjC domain-containing protein n=1 Tax=Prymnesium polylepis TaxID=72548 RepID=A0A6T7YJV8_9EUKA|mmetsp:Transcript_22147/g.54507  ORF Transcript_22147/g.54507 Transcript_22147/m.54507 type:complete len:378 (+) Transcript_22147:20-1153(+)